MTRLHLEILETCIPRLIPLLEKGVGLTVNTGCSLRDLLCNQLGMAEDYLDHRVQTLFLDARPVDDVDRTMIKDGATLALSSAMPGLLGATMRKGGRYAPFRGTISQQTEEIESTLLTGRITIKMFNMVAGEAGIRLWETGVEVDGADLDRVVEQLPGKLSKNIKRIYLDDQAVDLDRAFFKSLSTNRVRLSVTVVNHED